MKKITALASAMALVGAVGSANAQPNPVITAFGGAGGAAAVGIFGLLFVGILSASSSTSGSAAN